MKTTNLHPLVTALTLCFCVAAGPTIAATVTLQQGVNGYTNTTDSWLDESAHTDNYGGATYVRVQYNNGMSDSAVIRFGLPVLNFQSVAGATLGLDYYDYYSMVADNALWITPYRISPGMSWYENVYNGTAGHGVSWYYRDDAQSLSWTSQYGAWYDKIDDGNSMAKIKRPGGSVPDAIAPTNWVTWNVVHSVTNWYGGRENDGFVLFESGFEGNGSILAGLFYSRDFGTAINRPYLSLNYQGAQISWTGGASATWDTSALNWNVGGYTGTYGDGDFVTFADGAGNPTITITGGGVSPGLVTISNNSTAYSFSGGGIGGGATLTKSGGGSATLGAANGYSGQTLVKAGTLIVSANNALGATGSGTVVSNGAALGFQSVTYSSTEPATISGTGVSSSGALYTASGVSTFAGSVTMAANSSVGVGSGLYLTLNGTISGGFDLTKSGAGWLTLGGASANTYGGTTYVNEGTLALAKSTGVAVPNDLIIGDGTHAATCRLGAEGQLASACNVTVRDAGLLDLNNHSANIGNLTLTNGAASSGAGTLGIGGNVASSGNSTATISGRLNLGGAEREFRVANGTANDDLAVSAAVASGAILKTGPGRLVLGGNNTFDGQTTVSNGVLAISYVTALGSTVGGTIVADGARLELESNLVVGAESLTLNGSGGGLGALRNVSDTNSWSGNVTLASSAMIESDPGLLTLNGAIAGGGFGLGFNTTGDIIANGAISGAGTTVTKYSAGTLTFGGSHPNTYTGTTYVNMGRLTLAKSSGPAVPGDLVVGDHADAATVSFSGPGQLASSCQLSVFEQSSVNLAGQSATVASLTLTGGNLDTGPLGLLTLNGTLTANGSTTETISGNLQIGGPQQIVSVELADLDITAAITGGGFLKKGAGRLLLLGTNYITGNSVISGGVVLVNNDPGHGFGAGPGMLTVGNGGLLGGNGTIAGPVLVQPGGTISPGTSVGTLIVSNNLSIQNGGILLAEVMSPMIDLLDLQHGGALLLGPASSLTLRGALAGKNPYFLVRNATNITGTFNGLPNGGSLPMPNTNWFIHYGTHRIYLSRVAQPITYFRAYAVNGVVYVSWRTAEEVEVNSFDLFQWSGSDWQKVNSDPIPAQGQSGGIYTLIDSFATTNDVYQFRLVENTSTSEGEIFDYTRITSEFAFSNGPRPMTNGWELRWWARTDETYDVLGTTSLTGTVWSVTGSNLLATPPECVFSNAPGTNNEGYFRLRLVP